MKANRFTYLLVVLAALFITLGAVLSLWFYAVAGATVALYLIWRIFAFQSLVSALDLEITRSLDKTAVGPGGRVTAEVSVSSNVRVEGYYQDVLPRGVELVEGTNRAPLSLRAGDTLTLRYTLVAAGREAVHIERATLTLDNGLFRHTIIFTTAAREVEQSPYAVRFEAETGSGTEPTGITSRPVQALYRERSAGAGTDLSHARPFVTGDPLKRIHWKASARLNRLMTKEFFSDMEDVTGSGTTVNLIIDQSATMGRGPPGATELDFAVNVAGNFVKLAVAKGKQIGLTTYDDNGVATSLDTGGSFSHVSSVVRSLNEIEPSVGSRRPRRKLDVSGSEVTRVKRQFAATAEEDTDDDIRRFRYVISYLYSYSEGYVRSVRRAPGFRAIAASLEHAYGRSTLVLVSDLENDLGPIMEGIRLATSRGTQVFVVVLFSKLFEQFEDPLLAIEDIYAAYDEHVARIRKLEQIPNVRVIEANSGERLQSALKGVRVAP